MAARFQIHPLTGEPRRKNGHPRPELFELHAREAQPRRRSVEATYDAARDSDEFKNYWANADALDADSAHSKQVRTKLVHRSRYEVGNNGYSDGMTQTHANFLVGTGPTLRMQSNTAGFNTAVEVVWNGWAKAVHFRRKLWCMSHAKTQDGEAIGMVRTNPGVPHPVALDLVLIETEQCTTPYIDTTYLGYIDGIKFDEFGNPQWYDVLPYHPGSNFGAFPGLGLASFYQQPEKVPARFILHWYMLRRPGQHRGVPEFKSTLNTGASSRRFREATVAAAETAADLGAALLKTSFQPDEIDAVSPMSTLELQKRMLTALPAGWDAVQMKGEHPNTSYESFNRQQINETARPKSIPYNLAACDSSSYNYASGRLDHQTYFVGIDVEREDAMDLVLDPLFALWWQEACLAFGWNADPFSPPPHKWDWPKHPVADLKAEAISTDTKLRNGSLYPSQVYADAGKDFEDELPKMAADYGVTPDEMRQILRETTFGAAAVQTALSRQAGQAALDQNPPGGGNA